MRDVNNDNFTEVNWFGNSVRTDRREARQLNE